VSQRSCWICGLRRKTPRQTSCAGAPDGSERPSLIAPILVAPWWQERDRINTGWRGCSRCLFKPRASTRKCSPGLKRRAGGSLPQTPESLAGRMFARLPADGNSDNRKCQDWPNIVLMHDPHTQYNFGFTTVMQQRSEMGPRDRFVKQLLRNKSDDIPTLARMGITESAIIAYIVRVGEGMPPERALHALLAGRRLTDAQIEVVRTILNRLRLPPA
jgi:hypothetical protein